MENQNESTDGMPPEERRHGQPRHLLVACALLLLVIGTGNIFYGSHRVRLCVELITKVERNIAQPEKALLPLTDPTVNTDREQQQIRRLRTTLNFYQFVQRAGLWMIIFGIGASAASLLVPLQYTKNI